MAQKRKYNTEELLDRFYEGESSAGQERALRDIMLADDEAAGGDKAAAVMYELFRREREVRYPGATVPLRRRKKRTFMLRSLAAAVAAVLVVLGATVWKTDTKVVYCIVDGRPVTDYETALEQGEKALEIVSESLEATAAMLETLDGMGRTMRELEKLGVFESLSPSPEDPEAGNNS